MDGGRPASKLLIHVSAHRLRSGYDSLAGTGVFSMAYYRLYHVDRGRFARAEDFPADDDVHATRLAERAAADAAAELWCGARLVRKYKGGKDA